jgi:hypothetical protein
MPFKPGLPSHSVQPLRFSWNFSLRDRKCDDRQGSLNRGGERQPSSFYMRLELLFVKIDATPGAVGDDANELSTGRPTGRWALACQVSARKSLASDAPSRLCFLGVPVRRARTPEPWSRHHSDRLPDCAAAVDDESPPCDSQDQRHHDRPRQAPAT